MGFDEAHSVGVRGARSGDWVRAIHEFYLRVFSSFRDGRGERFLVFGRVGEQNRAGIFYRRDGESDGGPAGVFARRE